MTYHPAQKHTWKTEHEYITYKFQRCTTAWCKATRYLYSPQHPDQSYLQKVQKVYPFCHE